MQNPFESQDAAKTFARLMAERLAKSGVEVPFTALLEALAAGQKLRDWNTLSAAMPKTAGGQPVPPASTKVAMELPDWRVASMGIDEAKEEIGAAHLAPWTAEVNLIGDGMFVDLVDPAANIDPDADNEGDRSMWVGIELDRSVPKVLLAPRGGDNIANIWSTPDALYIESGKTFDDVVVIGADGSIRMRKTRDIDFAALGERPDGRKPGTGA